MTPGTISFDDDFTFEDGTKGKKLLVVLSDGANGKYIVIKTTSQSAYKGIKFGCQSEERYPNFYLPKGSCCLSKDTWVQLDQYFEFESVEFQNKHFDGRLKRIGVLPTNIAIDLLHCATISDDISGEQRDVLIDMLAILQPLPNAKK